MNEHGRGSGPSVVAGIAGGFGLLLFLLIAGFAGERLANVGQPGWAMLVALLTMCGVLAAIGGLVVWQQYRYTVASVDPNSVAGLRARREVFQGAAGLMLILFFGLPLMLVRQTYWLFAPWAALLSVLVCGALVVYLWQQSLRFADRYYSQLPPAELWQELQRYKPSTPKHARRFLLLASVFAGFMLLFLVVGYVLGLDEDATFPPRSVNQWFPFLNACNVIFITLSTWSQQRVVDRWRRTFHIVRG